MSDNPSAYPPPPPTAPQVPLPPPPSYLQQQQPSAPPPYGVNPTVAGIGGVAGLIAQFRGRAAWSCGIGLVTIVAPFVVHFVFYLLALVGLLYGIQAIRRGQLIGGSVGIALNIIGGLLTIILLAAG
jgi:hypothetical protein